MVGLGLAAGSRVPLLMNAPVATMGVTFHAGRSAQAGELWRKRATRTPPLKWQPLILDIAASGLGSFWGYFGPALESVILGG